MQPINIVVFYHIHFLFKFVYALNGLFSVNQVYIMLSMFIGRIAHIPNMRDLVKTSLMLREKLFLHYFATQRTRFRMENIACLMS